MKHVVIVAGNRGLGLEFTKQYLEAGNQVTATYRDDNSRLIALESAYPSQLSVRKLELTSDLDIKQFTASIDEPIDLLIFNAGVTGFDDGQPLSRRATRDISNDQMELALRVNALAPRRIIQALGDKLSNQPNVCVVYLTTPLALPSSAVLTGYEAYAVSKAAGNSLIWERCKEWMSDWNKKYSKDSGMLFQSPGAFAISPGFVRTDMGGPKGTLSPTESVQMMLQVIDRVSATKQYNAVYSHEGVALALYNEPKYLSEIISAVKTSQAHVTEHVQSVLDGPSFFQAVSDTSQAAQSSTLGHRP